MGLTSAIVLQRQPSKTSCGPTCAAMLVGVSVQQMLTAQPSVRKTPRRRRMRTHRTNVGEMVRLLKPYGVSIGRRLKGKPPPDGVTLLRVQHARGRGWHFMVAANGVLFDPMAESATPLTSALRDVGKPRLSFYEVEGGE